MTHHLLVVEGAHDAAFFGKLIKRRGFREVMLLEDLIEPWLGLVPRKFPVRENGQLDKIIVYPNVYKSADSRAWIGVAIAGGSDDRIVEALRAPIELNEIAQFTSIGIAIDADWQLDPKERFNRFMQNLQNWNSEEAAACLDGFPIELPTEPNKIVGSSTKFGVFVFPDSKSPGTLESLVLECGESTIPKIVAHVDHFIQEFISDDKVPKEHKEALGATSNLQKCQCGVIANILTPGASLAVALRAGHWLTSDCLELPIIKPAEDFMAQLFEQR